MKPGDKVIFNGGSSRSPIFVKGTVFLSSSGLFLRGERGEVFSTIGWRVETNGDSKKGGDRKDGS